MKSMEKQLIYKLNQYIIENKDNKKLEKEILTTLEQLTLEQLHDAGLYILGDVMWKYGYKTSKEKIKSAKEYPKLFSFIDRLVVTALEVIPYRAMTKHYHDREEHRFRNEVILLNYELDSMAINKLYGEIGIGENYRFPSIKERIQKLQENKHF